MIAGHELTHGFDASGKYVFFPLQCSRLWRSTCAPHFVNPGYATGACYKLLTAFSKLVDNLGQTVRTQLVGGLLQDVRFLLQIT